MCAGGSILDGHQIVTKTGAKRTKVEQIKKAETVAILRLAKAAGFNRSVSVQDKEIT